MDFFIAASKINAGDVVIDPSMYVYPQCLVDGQVLTQGRAEKLSDPDEPPPGLEPGVVSLLSEINQVLKEESRTIKDVFPYPEQVLGTFLQRVFQQSLQQNLESVLAKTETLSPLAFLRTLQASRAAVISLAEDLKTHGLTEHPDPLSTTTTVLLDQNVEELFVPYLQDRGYLDSERESLDQLYSSLLLKFTLYHSQRKKVANLGVLDRFKKTRERAIGKVLDSDLGKSQSEALSRIIGLDRRPGSGDGVDLKDSDGLLSVDFAKRMLKWLAEAVGRALELSVSSDTPKDVHALMIILIEHMSTLYLDIALDAALDAAESQKGAPDLTYLHSLRPTTQIMHLMFAFINTALVPLSQTSLTTRREMAKLSTAALKSLETKINTLIQRTVTTTTTYLALLLSKQKKAEYRPKDDEVSLTTLNTPTCLTIQTFLSRLQETAAESLDGANRDNFLDEVGAGFRSLLLDHLKKFQVNQAGAIMLSKDITVYRDAVEAWKVGSLRDGFELLYEIGNLFVVGPQALRERMRDGVLAKVKPGYLRGYLVKREDYQSAGIEKIVSTLPGG